MAELIYAKKRLQPIIEKFGIDPENDSVFQAIITLFNGQTDYQMWGIKVVYGKAATLDTLISIKEWADANPTEISNLSLKNLVSYKTATDMAKLAKEMNSLDAFHFVNSIMNTFNTEQRKRLKETFIDPIKDIPYNALGNSSFKKFHTLAYAFSKLPKNRQNKFVILMSAVSSVEDIMKHLKSAIEATYDWNREDFLLYLQNNCADTEICYDKDGVIIVRLDSFSTAKKLCGGGRTSWCLTRENRYFDQYTKDQNGSQFALFDFNKKEDHQLAHVGFTVCPDRGISNAHSTSNHSMTGDIQVDGKRWNINSLLEHHSIPKTVYIRLRPLKNYKWNKQDFLNKLNGKYGKDVKVIEIDENRIAVSLANSNVRDFVINHTLIRNLPTNAETSQNFAVLDFSKDANEDNALLCINFSKDLYGSLSFNAFYESYGTYSSDRKKYMEKNLNDEIFVGGYELKPSVLLHKYIDQENYEAAIKLLAENKDVNPNEVFYNNLPVIKAILKGRTDLFNALVNHPKYDFNMVEGFGEPIMNFLILYLGSNIKAKGKDPKPYLEMGMFLLKHDKYDNRAVDGLKSTLLHEISEAGDIAMPFLDYLLSTNEIDINAVTEFGYTPLDIAIEADNINIVKILLKHPDIKVSQQSKDLARLKNIDLGVVAEPTVINEKPEQFEDLFASVFSSL